MTDQEQILESDRIAERAKQELSEFGDCVIIFTCNSEVTVKYSGLWTHCYGMSQYAVDRLKRKLQEASDDAGSEGMDVQTL